MATSDETGAGMMGTTGFNSACFYRYARIDWQQLLANLGDWEIACRAVEGFLRATALDARQYDYRAIFTPEYVAGTTPARHQAALENIDSVFGKVRPLAEVLAMIKGAGR